MLFRTLNQIPMLAPQAQLPQRSSSLRPSLQLRTSSTWWRRPSRRFCWAEVSEVWTPPSSSAPWTRPPWCRGSRRSARTATRTSASSRTRRPWPRWRPRLPPCRPASRSCTCRPPTVRSTTPPPSRSWPSGPTSPPAWCRPPPSPSPSPLWRREFALPPRKPSPTTRPQLLPAVESWVTSGT